MRKQNFPLVSAIRLDLKDHNLFANVDLNVCSSKTSSLTCLFHPLEVEGWGHLEERSVEEGEGLKEKENLSPISDPTSKLHG